jgi:hypothetical protein
MSEENKNLSVEQQWRFACENIAQATPREWGALDERYYRAGLDIIIATRAEVEQRRAVLRAAHTSAKP